MKIEPLRWPENRPRTAHPKDAPFDGDRTVTQAARALVEELEKRSGQYRQPFAHSVEVTAADGSSSPRRDVDQGAAVYFTRNVTNRWTGKDGLAYESSGHTRFCFACDTWDRAADNLWALKLRIEALRGLERWGGDEVDLSLVGYRALPPSPNGKPYEPPRPRKPKVTVPTWAQVLDIAKAFHTGNVDEDLVVEAHRELVLKHHPDKGGDAAVMATINAARDEALAWLEES